MRVPSGLRLSLAFTANKIGIGKQRGIWFKGWYRASYRFSSIIREYKCAVSSDAPYAIYDCICKTFDGTYYVRLLLGQCCYAAAFATARYLAENWISYKSPHDYMGSGWKECMAIMAPCYK